MAKKKPLKPSFRIPTPKPGHNHGDAKKYNRKKMKMKDVEQRVDEIAPEGNVEFAEQDVIDDYPEIVQRLIRRVLELNAWVSDMSSLTDFPEDIDYYIDGVKREFGVDITPVADTEFSILIPYIARESKN